jgi:hypothetical protein
LGMGQSIARKNSSRQFRFLSISVHGCASVGGDYFIHSWYSDV